MADPILTTVVAPAAGSALGVIAVTLGVPVPVVMAAVFGATVAALTTHRAEWSLESVQAVLVAFVMALAFGIFCGPPAALALVAGAKKLPYIAFDLPVELAKPASAWLLALVGQKELLPFLLKKLGVTKGGDGQ